MNDEVDVCGFAKNHCFSLNLEVTEYVRFEK